MKFSDNGIIIGQKNYSENSVILKVFSQNHGIYRGFVRLAKSKKNQAIFQIGNLISFEWNSRIEESLGQFFYVDLVKSFATKIFFDRLRLNCCSSLLSIIDSCFIEREIHENLFEELHDFLQKLAVNESEIKEIIADYIRLELKILKTLGYGIDLSSCVVTNATSDLVFVSPKSAQAVSFTAGKAYEDKLLKLPSFLLANNDNIEPKQLYDGLQLSGYFLEKFIFAHNGLRPTNRGYIEEQMKKISV